MYVKIIRLYHIDKINEIKNKGGTLVVNKKEVLEIKKQIHPASGCYQIITGCFVNEDREVISIFKKNINRLSEDEHFRYMEIFKKGLSGMLGKTLLNTEFPTKEHVPQQERLLQLKESKLENETVLNELFSDIAENYEGAAPYMVLISYGIYDIPGKNESSKGSPNDNELGYDSDSVYEHILGCICPVELDKASLVYNTDKPDIQDHIREWLIKMPDKAFLYPGFEDRCENIHHMLYYTKKSADIMTGFLDTVFGVKYLVAAEQQQDAFAKGIELSEASFESLVKMKENIEELLSTKEECKKINTQELMKLCEKSGIKGEDVKTVMDADGVKELVADNLFRKNNTVIQTDDISIQLPTELLHLIEIHEIRGVKCLVVRPNGNVKMDDVTVRL